MVHVVWLAQRRPRAGVRAVTHLYVARNARAEGVHAPGVPASGCTKRKCTMHTSDWRAAPRSAENHHGVTACYERTSIADMAARRYPTEAHFVTYEMRRDGVALARQPRLCKDALSWVRGEGFEVVLVAFAADVDTPGHVPWTPELRAQFDALWSRGEGPLATCGIYLSPKGYRLIQPLLVPLEVEAGERALRAWIESLVAVGVWDNVRQVKDWTRHMRTPRHRREGALVEPLMEDWSRMEAIPVSAPAAAPATRRIVRRATPRAQVEAFEEQCPAGWEPVADQIGTAVGRHVTSDWRVCYLALSGALLERDSPPAGLPALVARAAEVAGAGDLVADRALIAQGTVARWGAVDASSGDRPPVLGYTALREKFPAVADALDAVTLTGVEARVQRQLAVPGPAPVHVTDAVATIEREIAQAFGVVVIAAPPGTGKTHAVVERARHLPVIGQRAAPGARLAVSAPRHDLAEQTASKLAKSLHLFSPPSLLRNGRPVCVYADAAKALANGRQSVRREFCEGRGKAPCDAAEGCDAREGVQGDASANLVVGVHGLVRELREYAGTSGTLVVDEPGEIVLTDRVTLDDLETAQRYLDAFAPRYASQIAPAVASLTAWVREVGPVEGALLSMHDAIRAGAHLLADDLVEAAELDVEHIEDAVLVAAAGAIAEDARTTAPPLSHRAVILARTSPGRAVELGRASKLLDLVWRGVVAKSPFALRIDERSGERAATVVSINADLVTALEHERVVVLDANAGLHLAAIARVLGHEPRFVDLAVADGAPIARTVLATGSATRRSWMPRGVPDWSAIVPSLRAALAWAAEDSSTRKVALIAPKELHVAFAVTLRPDDEATRKLVKESRLTKKALDEVKKVLAPVLATFAGTIVTGHFGALEGLDHMADCDATITLSDPRPNLGDEAIKCEYLGLDLDGRLDALAAAELQQAHGRLRTIHRTRSGRQLHVGSVVPSGWRDADVRRLPIGRPRTTPGAMTGATLREIRERSGMSLREFGRALEVSCSTRSSSALARYESGERSIPEDVARAALLLAPSVPETPSQSISYLGVSGTPSVQCPATGGFGDTNRAIPLQGVSGTPKARRLDITALLGAQERSCA